MTVSTTTNKVTYIGNGVAAGFAIPFPFLEKGHLKVWQLLNDVRTERTDWTVSDGNMVFETAPANNAQIVIMREVPLTQETDYRENEVLPAETLERCFDKLTMQVQQLKEQTDRAVTVDIFDDTDATALIPSIRQAVSDCAEYVEQGRTVKNDTDDLLTRTVQKAREADISAANAATSETNTAAMLGTKADIDGSNIISVETFRTNIRAVPMPTLASEIGQVVQISGTPPLALPAGGTWLYTYFGYHSATSQGFNDPASLLFGIAAGGTRLGSISGNRTAGTLNAWRIA